MRVRYSPGSRASRIRWPGKRPPAGTWGGGADNPPQPSDQGRNDDIIGGLIDADIGPPPGCRFATVGKHVRRVLPIARGRPPSRSSRRRARHPHRPAHRCGFLPAHSAGTAGERTDGETGIEFHSLRASCRVGLEDPRRCWRRGQRCGALVGGGPPVPGCLQRGVLGGHRIVVASRTAPGWRSGPRRGRRIARTGWRTAPVRAPRSR